MSNFTRLFVIDDEPEIRDFFQMIFDANAGYETQVSEGGHKCISEVESFRPDLLILDVKMPEISGPDILQALRKKSEGFSCPVIFITGESAPETLQQLEQLDASAILKKPFTVKQIRAVVEQQLTR